MWLKNEKELHWFPLAILWCTHVTQFLIHRDLVSWLFAVSSIITHLWLWSLSRYSLQPLSVGELEVGRTHRKTQHVKETPHTRGVGWRNEPKGCYRTLLCPGVLQDSSDCSPWQQPQQLLGSEPPWDPHLPPRAWDGHIKIPFLERGSGAEHQRTPLSSMSRGRCPSSYKITLHSYLKGVVVRWVWSLLPTNEQQDKRKWPQLAPGLA